jgi:phosphopantothenoylcysteine synthetase/decarboxylase
MLKKIELNLNSVLTEMPTATAQQRKVKKQHQLQLEADDEMVGEDGAALEVGSETTDKAGAEAEAEDHDDDDDDDDDDDHDDHDEEEDS